MENIMLIIAMMFLSVTIFFCLVRAIKGVLDLHPAGLYNTAVHYTIGLALVIALIYIPYTNHLFGARKWRELA